jgi:hypothetical protein
MHGRPGRNAPYLTDIAFGLDFSIVLRRKLQTYIKIMSTHQSLSTVALNLKVSESDLLDLEEHSWISSVAKNGIVFLSGREAFKARFILHLRRLDLTDSEITRVLEVQTPGSYSLAALPQILGRPIPVALSRRA